MQLITVVIEIMCVHTFIHIGFQKEEELYVRLIDSSTKQVSFTMKREVTYCAESFTRNLIFVTSSSASSYSLLVSLVVQNHGM